MDYLLAIGRLTRQKNFSFLSKNFKKIKKKYPELNLLISGDGEDKSYLQKIKVSFY